MERYCKDLGFQKVENIIQQKKGKQVQKPQKNNNNNQQQQKPINHQQQQQQLDNIEVEEEQEIPENKPVKQLEDKNEQENEDQQIEIENENENQQEQEQVDEQDQDQLIEIEQILKQQIEDEQSDSGEYYDFFQDLDYLDQDTKRQIQEKANQDIEEDDDNEDENFEEEKNQNQEEEIQESKNLKIQKEEQEIQENNFTFQSVKDIQEELTEELFKYEKKQLNEEIKNEQRLKDIIQKMYNNILSIEQGISINWADTQNLELQYQQEKSKILQEYKEQHEEETKKLEENLKQAEENNKRLQEIEKQNTIKNAVSLIKQSKIIKKKKSEQKIQNYQNQQFQKQQEKIQSMVDQYLKNDKYHFDFFYKLPQNVFTNFEYDNFIKKYVQKNNIDIIEIPDQPIQMKSKANEFQLNCLAFILMKEKQFQNSEIKKLDDYFNKYSNNLHPKWNQYKNEENGQSIYINNNQTLKDINKDGGYKIQLNKPYIIEEQKQNGGIIGDQMGLGKTYEAFLAIYGNPSPQQLLIIKNNNPDYMFNQQQQELMQSYQRNKEKYQQQQQPQQQQQDIRNQQDDKYEQNQQQQSQQQEENQNNIQQNSNNNEISQDQNNAQVQQNNQNQQIDDEFKLIIDQNDFSEDFDVQAQQIAYQQFLQQKNQNNNQWQIKKEFQNDENISNCDSESSLLGNNNIINVKEEDHDDDNDEEEEDYDNNDNKEDDEDQEEEEDDVDLEICDEEEQSQDSIDQDFQIQGGNLIILDGKISDQWIDQLKQHVKQEYINYICIFDEINRLKSNRKEQALRDLHIENYDIVFALQQNLNKYMDIFKNISWFRIIVEEAHNKFQTTYEHLYDLNTQNLWLISGTAMEQKIHLQKRMIKCFKITNWESNADLKYIQQSSQQNKILQKIFGQLMIRREQTSVKRFPKNENILTLPKIINRNKNVDFLELEAQNYHKLYQEFQEKKEQGELNNMLKLRQEIQKLKLACDSSILVNEIPYVATNKYQIAKRLLLFMQQNNNYQNIPMDIQQLLSNQEEDLQNHFLDTIIQDYNLQLNTFIKDQITEIIKPQQLTCLLCLQTIEDGIDQYTYFKCYHYTCTKCYERILRQKPECPLCKSQLIQANNFNFQISEKQNENFFDNQENKLYGGKLNAIVSILNKKLKDKQTKDDKIIIFYCSQQFLPLLREKIQTELERKNEINILDFEKACNYKKQQQVIHNFKTQQQNQILLASIFSINVGFDLQVANHIIMATGHYDPVLEKQAEGRVHRLGQQKKVFINKIYMSYQIDLDNNTKKEISIEQKYRKMKEDYQNQIKNNKGTNKNSASRKGIFTQQQFNDF